MFSQTTEYALRAMACLAMRPTELMPTPALAEQTKVPANYLAKVLQQLAAAKLITGRRGVGGGYKLAKAAGDIRLLEVIQAVSVLSRIHTCPLGLASHGSKLCALHKRADQAAAAVIEVYDGTTLQDLLNDPNPNKPLCESRAVVTVSAGSKR